MARSGYFSLLPFTIFNCPLYQPFQKNETMKSWHNWSLSNWSKSLNEKGSGAQPQSSKWLKRYMKISALVTPIKQVW